MAQAKKAPQAEDLADLPRLVERMRAGERRAISRAVTELERLSKAVPRLLELMQPYLGHALVVGFTGPPGAGKSTLVNAYTRHLRGEGKSIGIIAVDPSSPVSGGAILGDRIRMTATLDDDGVFMRSLASRGHLGGLVAGGGAHHRCAGRGREGHHPDRDRRHRPERDRRRRGRRRARRSSPRPASATTSRR